MRRYGGLDNKGLLDIFRLKSIVLASRQAQSVIREVARKAALLPIPVAGLVGEPVPRGDGFRRNAPRGLSYGPTRNRL
jgi:hypothetical protein